GGPGLWHAPSGWRLGGQAPFVVRFAGGAGAGAVVSGPVRVSLTGAPHAARAQVDETEFAVGLDRGAVVVDGARYPMLWSVTASAVWIGTTDGDREFTLHTPAPRSGTAEAVPTLD